MACYNWQGKNFLHFHQTIVNGNFFMIRASIILGLVEYHMDSNLIMNHDPIKLNKEPKGLVAIT